MAQDSLAVLGNVRTMADYVFGAFDRHKEQLFLSEVDGRSQTYGEAREQVAELWELFRAQGIAPGDRIALLGNNSINWALVYLAVVSYGAVVVPILPDFNAASIHNILQSSESKMLFVASALLERVEGCRFPQLAHVFLLEDFRPIDLGDVKDFMKRVRVQVGLLRGRASAYLQHRRGGGEPEPQPDDLAAIVYTSGTTGNAKGVMLTHRNLVTNIDDALQIFTISPTDRLLSILPLAHCYECTCGFLAPMHGGVSIYYLKGKPSPSVLLPAFEKVKPTVVFAVPLVMEKIYKRQVVAKIESSGALRALARVGPGRRFIYRKAVRRMLGVFGGKLRMMGFGGAALSAEVERFLREGRFPYGVGYGMTECAPLISGMVLSKTRAGSCGTVVPKAEVRIWNANIQTGIGEIQVKGPMVTLGYYRNPEATAELFTEDGWLRTGDLGRMDRQGYIYIVGRSKNVIVGASGENVYPEEIEFVVNSMPGVLESLVVDRGGRLIAMMVPDFDALSELLHLQGRPENEASERIKAHFERMLPAINAQLPASARLAAYVLHDEEFEKTPTNKIKRYLYA